MRGTPKTVAGVVGAVLAALAALGACDSGSNNPPPPPPAAFGAAHDWGNGNTVTVEAPHPATLPGDLKALVVLVKVTNGGDQAVPASNYHTDVKVDNSATSAAAFGAANLPQGQVQSHSPAQFPVVFEAPKPGQRLDVVVAGPNNLPAVTFEGAAPNAQ